MVRLVVRRLYLVWRLGIRSMIRLMLILLISICRLRLVIRVFLCGLKWCSSPCLCMFRISGRVGWGRRRRWVRLMILLRAVVVTILNLVLWMCRFLWLNLGPC